MAFCTQCGTRVEDGAAQCSQCGASLDPEMMEKVVGGQAEISEETPETSAPEVDEKTEETSAEEQVAPEPQPEPKTQQYYETVYKEEPVGMGTFFGLELVYRIPVIGLLVAIIMSFAPKNKSLKNYSRSTVVWQLIGLAVTALLVFAAMYAFNALLDNLEEATGQSINDLEQLIERLEDLSEYETTITNMK